MIVTNLEDFLGVDSRWRSWGMRLSDFDFGKEGGYAINDEFSKSLHIEDKGFGMYASELGSRAYHSYSYVFLMNFNGKLYKVEGKKYLRRFINKHMKNNCPPDQLQKTVDSVPYMYALIADYVRKTDSYKELTEYMEENEE